MHVRTAGDVLHYRRARAAAGLTLMLAIVHSGCSSQADEDNTRPQGTEASVARMEVGEAQRIDAAVPDEAEPDAALLDASAADAPLGEFELTYYWMAKERKKAAKRTVQLYTRDCKPLAKVTESYAERLAREGTGRLRNGRTINVSGPCDCEHSPCFFIVSRKKRWGVGVQERALSPFRTVAVDPQAVPIGTVLYIPELDGLTMPGRKPWGGFVHDGCVVADDTGGGVSGQQLDLFMARKLHYRAFDRRHRLKQVTVFDGKGRCERKGDQVVPVNRNST